MSRGADDLQTTHGRVVPTASAKLRPLAADELRSYGGAPLFRGKRVLDLGTGDGRLGLGAARWAASVVGLDADPAAIRAARRNARALGVHNVCFRVAPAQDLPLADGSFEVVILSWTL